MVWYCPRSFSCLLLSAVCVTSDAPTPSQPVVVVAEPTKAHSFIEMALMQAGMGPLWCGCYCLATWVPTLVIAGGMCCMDLGWVSKKSTFLSRSQERVCRPSHTRAAQIHDPLLQPISVTFLLSSTCPCACASNRSKPQRAADQTLFFSFAPHHNHRGATIPVQPEGEGLSQCRRYHAFPGPRFRRVVALRTETVAHSLCTTRSPRAGGPTRERATPKSTHITAPLHLRLACQLQPDNACGGGWALVVEPGRNLSAAGGGASLLRPRRESSPSHFPPTRPHRLPSHPACPLARCLLLAVRGRGQGDLRCNV